MFISAVSASSSVVAGEQFVRVQLLGVPREQVPPEHPAVRAGRHVEGVIGGDVVHPDVELIGVGDDLVADTAVVGEFHAGLEALSR